MKDFLKLYDAGAVKRWHTWPTLRTQDVAAHSWGVAMILHQIDPYNFNLLVHALTHDLHECELGDIPYPAKKRFPGIGREAAAQEVKFNESHGIWPVMSDSDHHKLKWADMFELLLWSRNELHMGNKAFAHTIDVAMKALAEMRPPNEAAAALYEELIKDGLPIRNS